MSTSRRVAASTASSAANATINLWINRGLESLWLLMVLLVPLAFLSRDYAVSEAVISYVEVPKIALLRTLAALMASLWLIEWAAKGLRPNSSGPSLEWSKFRPSSWLPRLAGWLRDSPGRWLVLAAWFFLGTTLLSTALSGSVRTSVWGEIPGQDGYSAYTVVAYLLAFGIIATHLKTRPQLWRLLGAVVIMGVLVAGYGVLQHYGFDFFDLIEETGGGTRRITAFMGNTIFAAAVMSMTIPISLVLAAVTLREPVWSAGSLRAKSRRILGDIGPTVVWSLVLAVQLLGITFTLSRGPWIGTTAALAIFVGLVLVFLGLRAFWRIMLVLVLASAFALAFLQSMGSISTMGQTAWFGAVIALLAVGGVVAVIANTRYLGRAAIVVGVAAVLAAAVALGPSWLGGAGSAVDTGTDQPITDEQATAGAISERFSSIQTNVLGGLIGGRGTHWKVSWQLIRDHPWFEFDSLSVPWLRPLVGYGPDLFRYTYLLRSPVEGNDLLPLEPDHAHNFFIHQTVEQGYLGLLSALGLFLAVFVTGVYQLLRRGLGYSNIHKLVLIGLIATIAGRFLEMMVGVARVSDLTVLWVLLAIFAALPVVMRGTNPEPAAMDHPPPNTKRRNQPHPVTSTPHRIYDWRLFLRVALVVWLLGGISVVTWVKSANYVRAAVAEGEALKHFRRADLQAALASVDRAIRLAPDVPMYHIHRAQVFLAHQINENLPPERGCSAQSDFPYTVCLAAQGLQSNLNGVSQSPYFFRSRLALANSAYNLKLNDEAIKFYGDASSLVPYSWRAKNELADAYLEAGQPEEALRVLAESLDITQDTRLSAAALYFQGRAYRELGRPEQAAAALERALSFQYSGDSARGAFETLAEYYASLESGTALDRLNVALRSSPEDPVAHYLRGQLFAQLDLNNQAMEDFDQSFSLGFMPAEIFTARGRVAQRLGRYNDASSDLSQAVHLGPENAKAHAYWGDFLRSGGEYQPAEANLDRALLLDPDLFEAYHFRGLLYYELGRFLESIGDLNHAISLDPGDAAVYRDRGKTYLQLGRNEQAIQDLDRAIVLDPGLAGAYYVRGLLYYGLRQYLGAIREFDDAINLDIGNATMYRDRGKTYVQLGRNEQAIQDLDRAIVLDSSLAEAHLLRGQARLALRQYEEAVTNFNRALDLNPKLPEALALRGRALLVLGRDAEAARDLEKAERLNSG